MTKQEFVKLEEMKKINSSIRSSAIICYVCAAITLVLSFALTGTPAGAIDGIILVIFGLILHFRQSFAAAVVLLAYSIINVVYLYMTTGRFGGWLILIAGIYSVMGTWKLNNAWKHYQATGEILAEPPKK